MKGYKTIATGLAMVILPPALQYLAVSAMRRHDYTPKRGRTG